MNTLSITEVTTESQRNEDQGYVIKKMLNKMKKKTLKSCLGVENL